MAAAALAQVFFATCLEDGTWDVYSPEVDPADFKQGIGDFTHSTFIPGSSEVLSATVDGDVVVWDESMLLATGEPTESGEMRRQAVKIIKLHTDGAVNFMSLAGPCIVTGGSDGYVRFYDFKLRLVAWFDDLDNGAPRPRCSRPEGGRRQCAFCPVPGARVCACARVPAPPSPAWG